MKCRSKMFTIAVILALAVFFVTYQALSQVPLPKEIQIKTPSSELPQDIAAFSGKWRGAWDKVVDFIIVVTEVDQEKAEVIYAWADTPARKIKAGCLYETAKVIPGEKPKIQFRAGGGGSGSQRASSGAWITFEMQKDLKSLKGIYEHPRGSSNAVLEKIE